MFPSIFSLRNVETHPINATSFPRGILLSNPSQSCACRSYHTTPAPILHKSHSTKPHPGHIVELCEVAIGAPAFTMPPSVNIFTLPTTKPPYPRETFRVHEDTFNCTKFDRTQSCFHRWSNSLVSRLAPTNINVLGQLGLKVKCSGPSV